MSIFINSGQGVTLSGGQRARVGLARAIYAKADLYILDDPLAAVDPEVAATIYRNCVQGILKSKTRILITHQYQFLTDADCILYLDGGKQLAFGNFDKVMSYESNFIQSLRQPQNKNKSKKTENEAPAQNDKEIKKLEFAKETRATGKIGFADFLYFLRACGSNSGLF